MTYDDNNIFARILRDEIPNDTVFESERTLAFNDITPKSPIHILIIPKGKYVDFHDFVANAPAEDIEDFWRSVQKIIEKMQLDQDGYRLICNSGNDGGQEVPHFHAHLLAGKELGPILVERP